MRSIKELFDLSGQVAIVTGGGYGLGYQMAYALGEAGANLVLCARKIEKCEEAAKKLEAELGIKVIPARVDLTSPAEIDALFDLVMEQFGRLDILINNSGTTWAAPVSEFPLKGWTKVLDTNLTGCWLMCQKACAIMTKQNYGRIVNISSMFGFLGSISKISESPAYNASKAAIIGLTKDLGVKLAGTGITVNALCPGYFNSHMGDLNQDVHGFINDYYIPAGRFGTEDELKAAVLFLASPGASYCMGATLLVDGGFSAC